VANRSDNFNRADSATALGTPSDGGSDWVAGSGTWGISSNQAYCVSAGGGIVRAYLEASVANVDVSVTFAVVQANVTGLLFRYADEANNWVVYNDGSAWRLLLRTGGSDHTDPNNYAVAAANGDVVRVVASGSGAGAIQVYINGTLRITSSQFETFGATATKHGLWCNFSTGSRWDNFTLTDLAATAQDTPELYGRPMGRSGQRQMHQLLSM
jgi:hypothetical protein